LIGGRFLQAFFRIFREGVKDVSGEEMSCAGEFLDFFR
jgi:hypothetical protein